MLNRKVPKVSRKKKEHLAIVSQQKKNENQIVTSFVKQIEIMRAKTSNKGRESGSFSKNVS